MMTILTDKIFHTASLTSSFFDGITSPCPFRIFVASLVPIVNFQTLALTYEDSYLL